MCYLMCLTNLWRLIVSTAKRTAKHAIASDDAIIDGFQVQFDKLGKSFYEEATRQTQLMVVRIQDELKDSGLFHL